jgi:acyl transferase domain-containing protein
VVQYALAQLFISWGLTPQALIGHSLGEYVAACLAGVFSLEDALALVAERGRLMQQLDEGAMLSVALSEHELRRRLGPELDLAAVNSPTLCVAAGPPAAIAALEQRLAAEGVSTRRLKSTRAFHSAMMEPVMAAFEARVAQVRLQAPRLPMISNVSGSWLTAGEASDPSYWAQQLRAAVQFAAGLAAVLEDGAAVLLDLGPGRGLSTLVRQQSRASGRAVVRALRGADETADDLRLARTALGQLWLAGARISWTRPQSTARRLALPTYPFERQRYWIAPPARAADTADSQAATILAAAPDDEPIEHTSSPVLHRRPDLKTGYVAPRNEIEQIVADVWQEILGIDKIGVYDDFFDLRGHSLLATQVIGRLRDTLEIDVPLSALFDTPTVAGVAQAIADAQAHQEDSEKEELLRLLELLSDEQIDAEIDKRIAA